MMDLYHFSKDWIDKMEELFKNPKNTYEVKLWENGKLVYNSHKENKVTKPNNNAPKSIKGDYDLSIHGNKIVLVDNKDGTTVETRCHPDDGFDIGDGIKEAFKKMNQKREEEKKIKEEAKKIKVGDYVKVINGGYGYPTYPEWLYDKVDFNTMKNYKYGLRVPNGTVGKVIAIGEHKNWKEEMAAFNSNGDVYIIGIKGLKKVKNP